MTQEVRQNNLFAAEDFRNVYRSFKNVDFRAYDFDSLKQAMIEYIKRNYPEDFNDYIESSEYIAIIELLAFLGTSLSFRVDLNARENFLDTAERRESVIRLAQMINYQPSRNLAANGLFKLTAVSTTEPVTDSLDRELSNTPVFWDDPNNPDSYDQFTSILNSCFSSSTPFGKPAKRGKVGGVNTDLYQLDNVRNTQVVFPVSISVNGERLPFNICNVDFDKNGNFTERHPDPNDAFHIAYRNDGNGFSSPNTGFFLYFRQGELKSNDFQYDFPVPNRNETIADSNINQTDVYLQQITPGGAIVDGGKWEQVIYSRGNESVVYNNIDRNTRKVYSVKTEANDAITIQYSDGSFGEIPTGILRVWSRRSANKKFTMRPEEARNLSITVPYVGSNSQTFFLKLSFSLEETVSNSSPTETNADIKVRAPQVYYTQNRMVNNQDYNTFPLTRGNEIIKLRTINRTHAGHSRYLTVNDPTGFHQSLYVTGSDGAFYKDSQLPSIDIIYDANFNSAQTVVNDQLELFLRNKEYINFMYDDYLEDYRLFMQIKHTTAATYVKSNVYLINLSAVPKGTIADATGIVVSKVRWSTQVNSSSDNIGYINKVTTGTVSGGNTTLMQDITVAPEFTSRVYGFDKFIEVGAVLKFAKLPDSLNYICAKILSMELDTSISPTATKFTLNANIPDGFDLYEVYPALITTFNATEKAAIAKKVAKSKDFSLAYVVDNTVVPTKLPNRGWNIIADPITIDSDFAMSSLTTTTQWVITASYNNTDVPTTSFYKFISRGVKYVFESLSDVRFFIDPAKQKNFSVDELIADMDEIIIGRSNSQVNIAEVWTLNIGSGWSRDKVTYPKEYIVLPNRDASGIEVLYTSAPNASTSNTFNITSSVTNGLVDFAPLFAAQHDSGFVLRTNINGGLSKTITLATNDTVKIKSNGTAGSLGKDHVLNPIHAFYESSGFLNTAKIEVAPADTNNDGIADSPYMFNEVVAIDDLVFFETSIDDNGEPYNSIWRANWLDLRSVSVLPIEYFVKDNVSNFNIILDTKLFLVKDDHFTALLQALEYAAVYQQATSSTTSYALSNQSEALVYVSSIFSQTESTVTGKIKVTDDTMTKITVNADGLAQSKNLLTVAQPTETTIASVVKRIVTNPTVTKIFKQQPDDHHVARGRSFGLDSASTETKVLDYKWRHFSPSDNRIDPSISNIMDMIILTSAHYTEVLKWKKDKKPISEFPSPPTSNQLRATFKDFDNYKMMSDEIIFGPGTFKIIFGPQAPLELRAKFKVVKVPTAVLTDNEIKTKVVQLIDSYFDINNWEFGETFYFTELAAYIHKGLVGIIGTIILVPESVESQFGNLFQVRVGPNEVLLSTAQATDVDIIDSLTDINMRLN